MRIALLLICGLMTLAAHGQDDQLAAEGLRTVAEASEYRRTARYDEVVAFLDELAAASDLVRLDSMGETVEGRSIPLAIIADPPVASAEEARKSKKLTVLLFGNIHAGEVCGKEALLMLARGLALGDEGADERELLKDLIVLVAPIYNADGNERFAPDNRPGQDGPEEMGVRANAQGLDLNRDWVKLEAPETRAFVRTLNEWDPAVIVDTHTTNGSLHRYTITYQGPKHPAGDREVIEYVRNDMLPAITKDLDERTDYGTFFYGNFADGHTKWTTYPAVPRYGAAYRGIRNRLTILSEAYAYAPFEDRVLGTLEFCRSVLHYSAENRGGIRELLEAADERTVEAGADDEIALRVRAEPFEKKVLARGFEETRDDEGRRVAGKPKEYEVELVNDFVATLSVKRPAAYLYPARLTQVTENLLRHGIEVGELREDLELAAEVYRIEQLQRARRSFEGHEMVMGVDASASVRTVRAPAGWMVVSTAQKLGSLAAYLLEPQAEDGLVAWNFLDRELEAMGEAGESGEFPIVRMMDDLALLTRPARKLPEDRAERKPITFEDVYGEGERPRLDGSPVRGIRWLDEKTLGHERDGRLWRIDALTGRMKEVEAADRGDVAGRLAEHPAIEEEAARNLARRHFRGGGFDGFAGGDEEEEGDAAPPRGVVFEHENDLYHAAEDGSGVVRLTSTPQPEELHQLSPDGAFVGFVRENDLWVVDVATQTERALTTGGRDDFRNGKADWVYFEELFGRSWKAWWWSPDSRSIAFLRTDASMVPSFTIIDDAEEPQEIETVRYPRPGEPNPHVRAGVVERAGGEPRRVDLSDYNVGEYLISHVGWTPDNRVRLYVQDRAQTWLDFLVVERGGGRPERLFRETTGAWVESLGAPRYLGDGSFLIPSERDGWQHLYLYGKKGKLARRVTEGEWEVRGVLRVDEEEGWVYFSGTKDSHIGSNLYRVALQGGEIERLTTEPGWRRVTLSPEGGYYIDAWSSFDSPQRTALRRIDGRFVRWLDTNPVYELEEYALGEAKLVTIPTEEGPELEGMLIYPPDFDPQRKYPVWFMTYAGPHAPTVRDSWSGRLHDRMLAQMGIVVFRADPYPASGKGAVSAWTAYQRLGERELSDIEQAIDWLCGHEYVDAGRIGMSGHSYGGFMTSYALTHSDRFCAGIAGAPVTDWRLYDTIYTERYMRTPQDNPDGYRDTSVVAAAENLHGRLLILHGTMDDNVHVQNSVRLVRALQRAEKEFEMFVYPGSRHGIGGRHYNRLVVDFIRRTVLEAPAPPAPPAPSEGERLLREEPQGVIGPRAPDR